MAEIVASVERVTIIMAQIASASSEQETGIGEINGAIAQMDNVTQQNAALVEEAAAAAESVHSEATHLMQLVGFFNVDDGSVEHNGESPSMRSIASNTVDLRAKVASAARPSIQLAVY